MSCNKMRIRTKIILSSLVIVQIGVVALGVTLGNTMRISSSAKDIAENKTDSNRLREIQRSLSEKGIAERDFPLTCDPAFLERREELEAHVDGHLQLAIEATDGHEHEILQ